MDIRSEKYVDYFVLLLLLYSYSFSSSFFFPCLRITLLLTFFISSFFPLLFFSFSPFLYGKTLQING